MKMLNAIGLSVCLILLSDVAAAQQPPAQKVALDISSQPIGDALNEFAHQAGLQVVFYTEIGKGLTSPPLPSPLPGEDSSTFCMAT